MNLKSLLTNAEFLENHVQDIFDVNPPEQAAERLSRRPQLFRQKFFPRSHRRYAALKRIRSVLQQFSLPLAADQGPLARPEIIPHKRRESGNQLRNSIASAGRNSEGLIRH